MSRTRIKICGLTRIGDVNAAISADVDAIGFVFYPPSPRYVAPDVAAGLAEGVPPFVTLVGLFVNAEPAVVESVLRTVQIQLLQFHGDEPPEYCGQFGLPWIKAARVRPGLDLVEFADRYWEASGLLLDAYVEGYGGAGQAFDWSLIPDNLPVPFVLSGGLHAGNVGEAIRNLHPWAVDVSSGVEAAKGIKDAEKIAAFVAAVKDADG